MYDKIGFCKFKIRCSAMICKMKKNVYPNYRNLHFKSILLICKKLLKYYKLKIVLIFTIIITVKRYFFNEDLIINKHAIFKYIIHFHPIN